jgi:hypothetical protein
MLRLDNLRPDGALRWKIEDRQLGRSGSGMWKACNSKVIAPTCGLVRLYQTPPGLEWIELQSIIYKSKFVSNHFNPNQSTWNRINRTRTVSMKDRWVRPHEQVLNVPIACRRYVLDKTSSLPSTEGGFTPTASMAVLGEKLGTNPRIGQPTCCGLCRELFFLRAVTLFNDVDDIVKGCCALTVWDMYGLRPYANWVWDTCGVLVRFPLQSVHRSESLRLSDMSNRLFAIVST